MRCLKDGAGGFRLADRTFDRIRMGGHRPVGRDGTAGSAQIIVGRHD